MRMNRRNVLVGLGTIVAGGGGALATGAFSSVDADRSVSIGVADDSNALLGIQAGSSEFVDSSNGIVSIDLSNVNIAATTTISDIFTIANNSGDAGGAQSIDVSANISEYGDDVGTDQAFTKDNVDTIVSLETSGDSDITTSPITLADEGSEAISLILDTTGFNASDFSGSADLVDQITLSASGQQS